MAAPGGSLRTLLGAIEQDDGARRLADEGGRAFVSASLRPYVIAALADRDEAARGRPMLVVVGDDRAARDLAGDLARVARAPARPLLPLARRRLRVASRAAAAPRRPARRGARTRCSARTPAARTEADAPVVVVSAAALSEKVPDPALQARTRSLCASASCWTSTSAPPSSWPRATSGSTRSRSAGSSRCAAACSTSSGHRGPRRAGGHVRRRDRIAALVLDLHAALARRRRGGRDRPRRRACAGAPRAGRARSGGPAFGRGQERRRGDRAPGHRRAAAGRALRRAARADRQRGRRRRTERRAASSPPKRRSSRR